MNEFGLPNDKFIWNEGDVVITRARRDASRVEFARATNFERLERALNKAERDIINHTKSVQTKQIDELVRLAIQSLEQNKPEKLDTIVVPYRQELADQISEVLIELFETGRRSVTDEVGKIKHELDMLPDGIKSFIVLRSKSVANLLGDRLKSSVLLNGLAQYRDGKIDARSLKNALRELSDKEIAKIAGMSVSEALNLGRDTVALAHKDEIDFAIFSAKMDRNTCGPCESADGIRVEVGSVQFERLRPPYHECDGRDRCRCVMIYVGK